MSESKSDIVKTARPAARGRTRKAESPPVEEQSVAAPHAEDEGFAAGIVDETPTVVEAPPPEPKPARKVETRESRAESSRAEIPRERGERAERVAELPVPVASVAPPQAAHFATLQ